MTSAEVSIAGCRERQPTMKPIGEEPILGRPLRIHAMPIVRLNHHHTPDSRGGQG